MANPNMVICHQVPISGPPMELTLEAARKQRVAALAGAIVACFQVHKPGLEEFGTAGLYEMEALQADLDADGIGYNSDDLAEALELLAEGAVRELDHQIAWRTVYRRVSQRATRVMVLTHRKLYTRRTTRSIAASRSSSRWVSSAANWSLSWLTFFGPTTMLAMPAAAASTPTPSR